MNADNGEGENRKGKVENQGRCVIWKMEPHNRWTQMNTDKENAMETLRQEIGAAEGAAATAAACVAPTAPWIPFAIFPRPSGLG